MRINEVCNLTGLTKKAIGYYEKQRLIIPIKDKNGYRDYSSKDIKLLNEISLYRKLDISIKEIKLILNSDNKKSILNGIIIDKDKKEIQIKMQKVYLEKIIQRDFKEEEIKLLNEEITNNEKKSSEFIKNELKRAFPDGLGLYLSYHFSPYLNEPIDSSEKYSAWINIVEFLDNLPELNIKIPKAIKDYYENTSEEMHKKIAEGARREFLSMVKAEGDELEKYKKKILEVIENQNDKKISEAMKPMLEFKKQMNEFYNNSGYYNIFLPNMKILSNEYKEYHKLLIELNEILSNCSFNFKKAARIIGATMGKSQQLVSDYYINYRVRKLIESEKDEDGFYHYLLEEKENNLVVGTTHITKRNSIDLSNKLILEYDDNNIFSLSWFKDGRNLISINHVRANNIEYSTDVYEDENGKEIKEEAIILFLEDLLGKYLNIQIKPYISIALKNL